MSCALAMVVAAVLLCPGALAKTVTGLFKSGVARQDNGQFISRFMYQGKSCGCSSPSWDDGSTTVRVRVCARAGQDGLVVCRLDNPSLAVEKESRLLLYQDMDPDLDDLSCSTKLSRAQFSSERQRVRLRHAMACWRCCPSLCVPLPPPAASVPLSGEEQNQTIPRQSSPTPWQLLYADRYTCQVRFGFSHRPSGGSKEG